MENASVKKIQKKAKTRGLLKSYYGINEKGNKKKINLNPKDIDSSAFDSRLYVRKVKKECNIAMVLKEDNKLVTEIKQLDGEMKSLIYDNYKKFINANDSIQNMRKEIDKIDTEMNNLSMKIETITKTSSEINKALSTSREKIYNLNGINLLLKKFQFMLELPARLNQCINQPQPQYAKAILYYSKTEKLLKKYRNISGFSKIDSECQEIINEISKKIKINDIDKSMKIISENVGLLIGLHFPPSQLFNEYSTYALLHLKKALNKNQIKNIKGITKEEIIEKIKKLNSEFLEELNYFIMYYISYFTENDQKKLLTIYHSELTDEEKIEANKKLLEITKELCDEYIDNITYSIELSDFSQEEKNDISYIINIFEIIHKKIYSLSNLNEITFMDERIINMTMNWIKQITDIKFSTCIDQFLDIYNTNMESKSIDEYKVIVENSEKFLVDTLTKSIFPVLKNLIKVEAKKLDLMTNNEIIITRSIGNSLKYFWETLFEKITKYSTDQKYREKTSPKLLLFINICSKLCNNSIESIYSNFIKEFYENHEINIEKEKTSSEIEKKVNSPNTISNSQEEILFYEGRSETLRNSELVVTDFKKLIQSILCRYTQLCGNNLIYISQSQFNKVNWIGISSSNPSEISNFWILALKQLKLYCDDINNIICENNSTILIDNHSESSRNSPNTPSYNPYSIQSSSSQTYSSFINHYDNTDQHLITNIDRLFNERIEYYSNIELNRNDIKSAIIKIYIKGIIENIRYNSFNKNGYYQIQFDSEVLKFLLWKTVTDSKIFSNLLEDLVISCRGRCSEEVSKREDFGKLIQENVSKLEMKYF